MPGGGGDVQVPYFLAVFAAAIKRVALLRQSPSGGWSEQLSTESLVPAAIYSFDIRVNFWHSRAKVQRRRRSTK
jgi:hypothetical protein